MKHANLKMAEDQIKRTSKLIVPMLFASLISFFAVTGAIGQDPVTVDAKHYKVEFENDQVRVLRISYGVNEKSVMHQHPDSIAIALTNTRTKSTNADGKIEVRGFKAGETLLTPAGTHLPENVGKAMQVILVELKAGSGGGPMPSAAEDSVKVSPKYHKVDFENERVRVTRSAIRPGEKSGMHGHPANVVIFLTDARVKTTSAEGKTDEVQGKAGQVTWRDPLKHDTENIADRSLEAIVVELKGK